MANKSDILTQLHAARSSAERTRIFAHLMDTLGVDALIGLVPLIGDAGVSAIATTYLVSEAIQAGLTGPQILKIVGNQALDATVGSVSTLLGPRGDTLADYSIQANHRSADLFETRVKELEAKAKKAGLSDRDIADAKQPGSNILHGINTLLSKRNVFHHKSLR